MAEKNQRPGSGRGFAAMDEAKQREIARKGGESVPPEKRSFSQNHELAAEAGRKGGQSVAAEDRSFSRDRGLAAEAGRKGGQESGVGKSGSGSSNSSSGSGGGADSRSTTGRSVSHRPDGDNS
jgi:general stress protein YciG